jgi:hypothetical protein
MKFSKEGRIQEIRPAIITDMSEAVLAGRLGELCQQMMRDSRVHMRGWPS